MPRGSHEPGRPVTGSAAADRSVSTSPVTCAYRSNQRSECTNICAEVTDNVCAVCNTAPLTSAGVTADRSGWSARNRPAHTTYTATVEAARPRSSRRKRSKPANNTSVPERVPGAPGGEFTGAPYAVNTPSSGVTLLAVRNLE